MSPGPIIIGANGQTSGIVAHYDAAFGTAVPGKAGYLKKGVDGAATRLTMSVNQGLADASLAGHVIYVADAYNGRPEVPIVLLLLRRPLLGGRASATAFRSRPSRAAQLRTNSAARRLTARFRPESGLACR